MGGLSLRQSLCDLINIGRVLDEGARLVLTLLPQKLMKFFLILSHHLVFHFQNCLRCAATPRGVHEGRCVGTRDARCEIRAERSERQVFAFSFGQSRVGVASASGRFRLILEYDVIKHCSRCEHFVSQHSRWGGIVRVAEDRGAAWRCLLVHYCVVT